MHEYSELVGCNLTGLLDPHVTVGLGSSPRSLNVVARLVTFSNPHIYYFHKQSLDTIITFLPPSGHPLLPLLKVINLVQLLQEASFAHK
jgi:hypothetical protein